MEEFDLVFCSKSPPQQTSRIMLNYRSSPPGLLSTEYQQTHSIAAAPPTPNLPKLVFFYKFCIVYK